jgi:hypothetical protein
MFERQGRVPAIESRATNLLRSIKAAEESDYSFFDEECIRAALVLLGF